MKTLLLLGLTALLSHSISAQTVSTLATDLGVDGDGIFVAPSGEVYLSGGVSSNVVLRITPDGTVGTFVSDISSPVGIYMNSSGDFFVNSYSANRLNRISPDGTASTFATGLNGPAGVVVDSNDEILISEFDANFSGNSTSVRRVLQNGTVEPFAVGGGIFGPVGIAVDEDGVVYVANWSTGEIHRTDGVTTTLFADIGGSVNQIAYSDGYLYAPSMSLRQVFRIDRDGEVEILAGSGASGTADGPALEATFVRPNSVAIGPDGNSLYVIDAGARSVRVIHFASDTAAEDARGPARFTLHASYPNPANADAHIRFHLDDAAHVRIIVFDMLGRTVSVPANGYFGGGSHETVLDTSRLPAGAYGYRLESGGRVERSMFTVVR